MRKHLMLILLAFAALSASSCLNTYDNDLDVIERRIKSLEEKCQKLNTQIDALRQVVTNLEEYDFITKVEPVREGLKIVGYRIHFTHSGPITLLNGSDAGSPVMGVAKGEDGVYYWTVKYPGSEEAEFVLNNVGERIPASAASPELKIENGYWFVTYDGGKNWHNLGKATADDGVTFFSSVEQHDNYILFKLINGTEIKVPTWDSFKKLNDACDVANKNLASFSALAQALLKKVYATDIQPIVEDGKTIGYRLFLSDGTSYPFYNGTATNAPVIGSAQDPKNPSDTSFYWTIQYSGQDDFTWLLDENGQKIRADASTGQTVQLTLLPYGKEGKYYWAVSYGKGKPQFLLYDGQMIEANAQAVDGLITSVVSMSDNRVFVLLSSKQYVYIPLGTPITVTFDAPVVSGRISINASETVSFNCHVASGNAEYELLPIARDGFYAVATRVDDTTWTISLTAPSTFAASATSQLNLLISNGAGSMLTASITILHK